MASLIYLAPVLGIVALLFAFVLAGKVNKMDEGTDRMQEIAASIREGARAFLSAEYKILVIFAAVLFILIGFGVSWPTAICFVVGAIFSTLAGTQKRDKPIFLDLSLYYVLLYCYASLIAYVILSEGS